MTGKPLTSRDVSRINDSPPLQELASSTVPQTVVWGQLGRGWGVSAGKLDQLSTRASQMRNEPTAPEKRLWAHLSRSQLGGYKFRRQAVIGTAIADFLCPQKGLIVEVDGDTHTDPAADARRTERLVALGYHVVRVTNDDVMRNVEGVCEMLLARLDTLPMRRPPHPNPSPEGEGLKKRAEPKSPSPSGEGLGVGPVHRGRGAE